MAKISVYNVQGEEVEKLEIADSVFDMPSNNTLLHQVFVALMANIRGVYAHTKTRSEVSGSGKKPWKQKGTGRARVGSVRTPVWKGGGIVFGPRNNRNFVQKINQKMRRKAVMIALSEKIREGKLIVLDALSFPEQKTKLMAATLKSLNISNKSVVMGLSANEKEFEKVSRNIPRLKNILADNVNVADLLNHQYFVVSKESLQGLEKKFLPSQEEKAQATK
ncbi:MAG: 50S ribosomal protein L4 [Candidatus Moranbacteria bacterium]|nr:50S ribosomal protein L4 [Candidatus Moranbacteria bacterium]